MKTILCLTLLLSSLVCVFSAQSMEENRAEVSFLRSDHLNGSTSPPAKTEKQLYDNRNRCLTVDATNAPSQSFTWGLDALGTIDAAGGGAGGLLWITDHSITETHLACTDGNANVVNLVSSTTKAVTATYEYTPFGELLRVTGSYSLTNPFRFSTKPQDSETGLYDYGFRSYKPSWASWLGRDPLGELGGNNLYAFIGSDSVNDVDSLGLFSLFKDEANSLSLLTHLSLLGETLTERDTYNQMGDNFNSLGRGVRNGARGTLEGIASLPKVAQFVSSGEAAEMIDRLVNDEEFRNEFAKQMGDSACDFLDKISSNDGAFEAAGEQFVELATGALKAINIFRKLQKLIPEKRGFKASLDDPFKNTFSSGGQGNTIDVDFNAPKSTLYHYTDDAGVAGITKSKQLNPSLKANNPKDARYGNGQYLTDIAPGTKTGAQLSREFLGIPFQGKKFKNYVEIDVTGLPVKKGRDGVFVVPNETPLDISKRLIGSGLN